MKDKKQADVKSSIMANIQAKILGKKQSTEQNDALGTESTDDGELRDDDSKKGEGKVNEDGIYADDNSGDGDDDIMFMDLGEKEEPEEGTEKSKEQEKKEEVEEEEPDFDSMERGGAEQWKGIKTSRTKWKERALKAEQESKKFKESQVDPAKLVEESEVYQAVLKERDDLKDIVSDIDFENSADFKEAFKKPVEDAAAEIQSVIPDGIEPKDEQMLGKLLQEAGALAGHKSAKARYFALVDKIKDTFYEGSMGTMFTGAMVNFWKASENLQASRDDKMKKKGEAIEKRQNTLQGTIKTLESSIDEEVKTFEDLSKDKIELWKSPQLKDVIKYDDFKKEELPKAKQLLSQFLQTGKITPEFRRMLLNGVYGPVYAKERIETGKALRYHAQALKQANSEIRQLKEALEKRGVRFGKPKSEEKESTKKSEWKPGQSIIAQEMIAAGHR